MSNGNIAMDQPQRGKVRNIRDEIKEYKDPKTGARIRQLTSNGSNNVHPYFTSWAFIGDDSDRTLFTSNRAGRSQWFMLEISTGKLVQLTDIPHGPNGCVARNGHLFYFDANTLHALKIDALEDRTLYTIPDGFHPNTPTCTADGRYVVFVCHVEFPYSTTTGAIYSTSQEEYYQHGNSVVMRVDTTTGEARAVWGDVMNISHVLIHPMQPNIVLFCHEGGSTVVSQRMWIVDINQKIARKAMPLYPQKSNEGCVHEFWTQQGDVGFQYFMDRGDKRDQYNAFIRPDGTWIRQHLYPGMRPGHIQSNSHNTLVIGDCAYLTPDDQDGNQYMALMTHDNGLVRIRRLSWHRSSWLNEAAHPHASFSPDDRWVIYNSDVEKCHNIYMADVHSI
jgi:oligogalacturonide lyase